VRARATSRTVSVRRRIAIQRGTLVLDDRGNDAPRGQGSERPNRFTNV
jgi:hypothetical protein